MQHCSPFTPPRLLTYRLAAPQEVVLTAEYSVAVQPPTSEDTTEVPDWVGAVSGTDNLFVSGCYDGTVRLHGLQGGAPVWAVAAAHAKPVTSLHAAATSDGGAVVASGSKDCIVKVWSATPAGADAGAGAAAGGKHGGKKGGKGKAAASGGLTLTGVGMGHEAAVQCVQLAPGGSHLVSSAWDGNIRVWSGVGRSSTPSTATGAGAGAAAVDDVKKRRRTRTRSSDAAEPTTPSELTTAQTLGTASQCIAGVAWAGDNRVVAGGHDHTLYVFDVDAGGSVVATLPGGKVISSLAVSPASPSVVVTAHPDHWLRVWDTRASAASVVDTVLKGHNGWVTDVDWSPATEHNVVSCSHDGAVRMWDVRAPESLFSLGKHNGKALCVAHAGSAAVVSGGQDRLARVFTMGAQSGARAGAGAGAGAAADE